MMLYMIFSVWLKTGSNQADIKRFRSHTRKYFLSIVNKTPCLSDIRTNRRMDIHYSYRVASLLKNQLNIKIYHSFSY